MSTTPSVRARAVAAVIAYLVISGCTGGSGTPYPGSANGSSCPEAFGAAKTAVTRVAANGERWVGPSSGPRAATGKTVVYIAQTLTNPGVVGVAKGAMEAAGAIGWNLRIIDGEGTPGGVQVAVNQALGLKPDGIIVGGFSPGLAARQIRQANEAGIPVVGWHAVAAAGPSDRPRLFTNVTTKVEDVAKISAQWIISASGGSAGVVVFTDSSIPFAENKSQLIKNALSACRGIRVLSTEDIPVSESSDRTPQRVSALIDRFGDSWTYSVAINDLYFADAAGALHEAGKDGASAPFNIGAGDGDPVAFQRIRDRQYQTATVPEPLLEQGWQIIDELNRAFAGRPASRYVDPIHLTTTANVDNATYWEPNNGYREHYTRIWGR